MTTIVNAILCCAVLVMVVLPLAWASRSHSGSSGEPPAPAAGGRAMPH
jgi:hypothetical protein